MLWIRKIKCEFKIITIILNTFKSNYPIIRSHQMHVLESTHHVRIINTIQLILSRTIFNSLNIVKLNTRRAQMLTKHARTHARTTSPSSQHAHSAHPLFPAAERTPTKSWKLSHPSALYARTRRYAQVIMSGYTISVNRFAPQNWYQHMPGGIGTRGTRGFILGSGSSLLRCSSAAPLFRWWPSWTTRERTIAVVPNAVERAKAFV